MAIFISNEISKLAPKLQNRVRSPFYKKYQDNFAYLLNLVTEDAILRDQILVAYQQLLIDSSSDIRQQVFPVHPLSPATLVVHIAGEYPGS